MIRVFAAALIATVGIGAGARAATISGAGATFPAPVYAKWAEEYKAQTGNALNYQAIGSGGGIKQINAGTVDFGASDMPLKADELAKDGLQQFPTVIGGVVPVMNLPGIKPGQVKLTGAILADIYRGVRKNWNDPVIASYNPGVKLPNLPITVVHRSDGSGTTFLFTSYLAMEARHWASGPGANVSVNWPVGIGGKGNDGVAAFVKQTVGSIGYVEYAYALENHMDYALLKNKSGRWVAPTAAAFAASAAGAKWSAAPGYYLLLLNQPGAAAWPISGATFILMHKKQANPQTARAVLSFFDWAYKNGDRAAQTLDYVTLPEPVKALMRRSWLTIVGPDGKPVYH
ncbi:MAG TPA: phosphate ABC transporter substrate-binding protein PstS [Caulobacteraceae bacterium]|jgi:phosphate transport system substrate-binding protein|nr:phosphate ABC transporter substrate-binding protein PstS [Caulobacteraceae bacterium]